MAARTFRELEVFKKAHAWVLGVYQITRGFPREELFGLTSQLRRAAVSVPANIAEGFVKRGKNDKLRYYNIAQGSLEECRYYLILSNDLGYGDTSCLMESVNEVSRMLASYISAIQSNRLATYSSLLFWLLASGSWLLS